MQQDIESILISRDQIARRIAELAGEIAAVYHNQELIIIPVLTGSIIFLADLVRCLPLRMRIDVMAVSSYPGKSLTPHPPRVLFPTTFNVQGKPVLVLDDILDSGRTLRTVTELLQSQGAASVKTAVLLRKRIADAQHARADFVGFDDIPNAFVVGYGLDYDNLYRNLPDIAILHPHVLNEEGGI